MKNLREVNRYCRGVWGGCVSGQTNLAAVLLKQVFIRKWTDESTRLRRLTEVWSSKESLSRQ